MHQPVSYLSGLSKRLKVEIDQAIEKDNLLIARLLGMALLEAEERMAKLLSGAAK